MDPRKEDAQQPEVRFAPGTQRPLDLGEPTAQEILSIMGEHPVDTFPTFVRMFSSAPAGLFLSMLLYWTPRATLPHGWIYKSEDEMEEETGLKRTGQRTARKLLKDANVLLERHGPKKRLEYKIEMSRLKERLEAWFQKGKTRLSKSNQKGKTRLSKSNQKGRTRLSEHTERTFQHTHTARPKPRGGW